MFSLNLNATAICHSITEPLLPKCETFIQNAKPKVYAFEAIVLGTMGTLLLWRIAYFVHVNKKLCHRSKVQYTELENADFQNILPRRKVYKLSSTDHLISSVAILISGITAGLMMWNANSLFNENKCSEIIQNADIECIFIINSLIKCILGGHL